MGRIIGFAGRMRSGKTELSNICEKKGYNKLYFALPLKMLCSKLLNKSIDELNKLKADKTELGITIDDEYCKVISEETNIPLDDVEKVCKGVVIKDVRHLLQFIGTDLIRKYNTNWHVERIRAMIDKGKDYVIDDVRFPNELGLINELGGDCWFVVRPLIDNVSNHESEISLRVEDFGNKIIINDSSLYMFKFKWETFFGEYEKSVEKREKYINSKTAAGLYDVISEPFSMFEMLEMSIHMFKYKKRDFNCDEIESVNQGDDLSVDVKYEDGSHEYIKNPLNIEDLKMCL